MVVCFKDREIGGLNEQLEEDSRTMGHLQVQLQQERTKRMQASVPNHFIQNFVSCLAAAPPAGAFKSMCIRIIQNC